MRRLSAVAYVGVTACWLVVGTLESRTACWALCLGHQMQPSVGAWAHEFDGPGLALMGPWGRAEQYASCVRGIDLFTEWVCGSPTWLAAGPRAPARI